MYQLQPFDRRITSIICAILSALSLIAIRLAYLQIVSFDYYITRGEKNFTRAEPVNPYRGNVYDCNGALLATNRPATTLYWNGTGNRLLSSEQENLLSQLHAITHSSLLHPANSRYGLVLAERQGKRHLLAKDISVDVLAQIKERFANHPNISFQTDYERLYPHGTCCSHIVGYLGRNYQDATAPAGKMGLEKLCDDALRGKHGTLFKTVNARGKDITQRIEDAGLSGADIHTTIDLELQKAAESVFPADASGCIVILDPEDGAIKTLVSRPGFDPSLFLKPISHQAWATLQENNPFINRALAPYPPGSIFKLITISAALESRLFAPDQKWDCKGFVPFAGRKYYCHRRWGHGELSTPEAIAKSCNSIFYELAKKLDIDVIAEYAHRFGLGASTNFLFHDNPGIVPSREWKFLKKGEKWWPGETLSVVIGQSFLLATPLQIARMISAIFTGLLTKPRILSTEPVESELLNINPKTLRFLQCCMRLVVTQGTGRKLKDIPHVELYAKTSTAQIADMSKRKLRADYSEHAWFGAYMKSKDKKPLVFVILVEHAGSSQVASTIARELVESIKKIAT